MRVLFVARLPIIEDLTHEPVPAGSNLLVEFDPSSQWYNAHVTIAAGWLKTGGRVWYHIAAHPLGRVRTRLRRLGVSNVDELEQSKDGILGFNDWYTSTLARIEREEIPMSLKVSDASIDWAQGEKTAERMGWLREDKPPLLRIFDNVSILARFNDDKAWVEFLLTRFFPRAPKWNQVAILGVTEGLHSEWVYKTLEGASDCVIDFKLEETAEETRDIMRIRAMRNVDFDRKWHELIVNPNSEVALKPRKTSSAVSLRFAANRAA
jgi:hypothetical protein